MAFGPPADVVVAVEEEEADEWVTIVVLMGFSIDELERVCNSGLLDGPLMVVEPAYGLPFSSVSINRIKNSFLYHLVHIFEKNQWMGFLPRRWRRWNK